jgi:ubiquinone/menaquinone biosynthesis C-methylase UbiE
MATIDNSLEILIKESPLTLRKLLQTFFENPYSAYCKIKSDISSHFPEPQIYEKLIMTESIIKDSNWIKTRAENRAKLRISILQSFQIQPSIYMDYGAGEGDITMEMQRELTDQFPDDQISGYVVDIAEWHGHQNLSVSNNPRLVNITLSTEHLNCNPLYDLLPSIADETLDVIFIEMVLHHLTDDMKKRLYRTLHRTLTPHGCVIIREHGPSTSIQTAYIHVQHGLYGAIEESQNIQNSFFKTYYAKYQSQSDWFKEWSSWDFVVRPLIGELQWVSRPFGQASTFYTILQKPLYYMDPIQTYLRKNFPKFGNIGIITPAKHQTELQSSAFSTHGSLPTSINGSSETSSLYKDMYRRTDPCDAGEAQKFINKSLILIDKKLQEIRWTDFDLRIFTSIPDSGQIISSQPVTLIDYAEGIIETRLEFGIWSYTKIGKSLSLPI